MMKHAYLIMCHNNFGILEKLVSVLDDPRNDIYIHVDKKVRNIAELKSRLVVSYATVYFTKRIRVNWGGYSQIKAELILLQEATKESHSYYHLLSGVDMPLKSQNEIYSFFEDHQGVEYISIDEKSENGELFAGRIKYYRFLQDYIGRNCGIHIAIAQKMEHLSLNIQRRIKSNRLRAFPGGIYKGGNWFSITHQMAEYILKNKHEIKKKYSYGLCVDELFLQTIAVSSPYAANISRDTMRYTDWERGSPYTFRTSDYDALIFSEKLFARKFDEKVDMEIVERIHNHIKKD